MSKNAELARLLCEFLLKIILDQERLLYPVLSTLHKEELETLQSSRVFVKQIARKTINYFNTAYKALILRKSDDDAVMLDCFDQMHDTAGHSYICLLNVAVAMCMHVRSSIDYSLVNYDSEEKYLLSIAALLAPTLDAVGGLLKVHFLHKCCGTDIRTCNPHEPMFGLMQ